MRVFFLTILIVCMSARAEQPEFFAFDNGVGRDAWSPQQQAATLRELGYSGISYNYTNPEDLKVWVDTFKAHDLKIFALYVHAFPDRAQPYDATLHRAIATLEGSGTVIWLTLHQVKDKGRDYTAESVAIVRDVADRAAAHGLSVSVYPHANFYVETAADAARIVKLVDRPNVGATINLCHEFITGNGEKLRQTIDLAAGVANLASINGVDRANRKYILRLDQGDFDIPDYLRRLFAAGYRGPIGLQCYQVPGDTRENLRVSIEVFKTLCPPLPPRTAPTGPPSPDSPMKESP